MIHAVRFANTNTFIKSAKNVSVKKYDADGNELYNEPYKGNFIPGTGRWYSPNIWQNEIAINLTQKEIDELVKDLYVYDDEGKQIFEAPKKNPRAKFWKKIQPVFLENAGKNFDDDIPMDRFYLKCFEADPSFSVNKTYNEALSGKIKFTVTKASDVSDEKYKEIDEVAIATGLYHKIDFNKKVQILRAFGMTLTDPDPIAVDRAILERITTNKNRTTDSGERYVDLFIRMANTGSNELNIMAAVSAAINKKLIMRAIKANVYKYGEMPVGKSKDEVVRFFSEAENSGLLEELIKKTNGNKN